MLGSSSKDVIRKHVCELQSWTKKAAELEQEWILTGVNYPRCASVKGMYSYIEQEKNKKKEVSHLQRILTQADLYVVNAYAISKKNLFHMNCHILNF